MFIPDLIDLQLNVTNSNSWVYNQKLQQSFKYQGVHNQTFHYTRRFTPKCVTSLRCLSLRHSAKATQLPA